jgi:hypothetical protein
VENSKTIKNMDKALKSTPSKNRSKTWAINTIKLAMIAASF